MRGQTETAGLDLGPSHAPVEAFLSRVAGLTDDERAAVAAARASVDEAFHEKALAAAADALVGRGEEYALARRQVSGAHLPERLAAGPPDRDRWTEISRLVQLAIDEALAGLLVSDLLHPNNLRELHRPWRALSG